MPSKPMKFPNIPLFGIRNAPTQMQKWFNTTYGFVMGIAAAALSIGVVSAAVVGIVIGSMAFIVYTNQHIVTNRCIANTKKAYIKQQKWDVTDMWLPLEDVNTCRNKNGLSKLTKEKVIENKLYPRTLGNLWGEPVAEPPIKE